MNGDLFTISEVARYARISRDTLLFYDKIGLLSPSTRGENNYRYYSQEQLAHINVIKTLQELGMPLKTITGLRKRRTPELVVEVLNKQTREIDKKIKALKSARTLLTTLVNTVGNALTADESVIKLVWREEIRVAFGSENDYSDGRTFQDALLDFYRYNFELNPELEMNYSVWGEFSGERIKAGDWRWPNRYFFNNPQGRDRTPAGWYVMGYARGGYGATDDVYQRLLAFAETNELTITGPAYETYPLNEISIIDPNNYLIQVFIRVEEPTEAQKSALE
ncbi:MAG: MerR family transcriptional regulator [Coriobacteriales bacterium]|jgi:DNA-binding transcriptional MerR regulator|nr:MerR family transcriptional regulator [Coriobacteriales bacterium]